MRNHALRRIAAAALIIIILAVTAIGVLFRLIYYNFLKDTYKKDAEEEVGVIESIVELKLLDSRNDDPEVYQDNREFLRSIAQILDMSYLYVIDVDKEADEMKYIFCVGSDDEDDEIMVKERGRGTVVKLYQDKYILGAFSGGLSGPDYFQNSYGNVFAFYKQLEDEDGDVQGDFVLGLEYDITAMVSRVNRYTVLIVGISLAVLLAVLGALLLKLNKKVFRPIKRISVMMNCYDPEKEQERLNIHSYREIEEISESFGKMSDEITRYIADLHKMETERANAAAELGIARRIQSGMVPEEFSLGDSCFEVSACAYPAREVGGDFYDCFELGDRVFAVMADVSGKGIAAALFMAMCRNLIREKFKSCLSPAQVLNLANDELGAENPEGMFVTVFAACLDKRTGELRYANAGHTRPVLITGDGCRLLHPDPGTVLGVFEAVGIIDEVLILEKGEGIMIYTDGITEAVSAERKFFGEQGLLDAVSPENAASSAASVIGAVRSFSKDCEQSDDITLLSLFYTNSGGSIRRTFPCEKSSLTGIRKELMSIAEGSPRLKKILLACEEFFANIVMYSGSEEIGVILSRNGNELTVRSEDRGTPFDPFAELPQEKAFEEFDTGGMGISLVMKIVNGKEYTRIGDMNITVLTFEL